MSLVKRIGRRVRRAVKPAPAQPRRPHAAREAERREMLAELPRDAVCAEIGTWRGGFAATILADRSPRQLFLIDPWEHRVEETYEKASYGGNMQGGQRALDAMHQDVLDRFAEEIAAGQVVVLRKRSTDAASTFSDESLDWIYIDGDHSYDGVTADLEAYARTVKPGGRIAGDDYGHQGSWFEDGVKRAVDELAARTGAELQVIGTQFVLRMP
jgi:SAM-dependent methyltransferase